MKFERSKPFFNSLLQAPTGTRMNILQAFPNFVVDDMIEILYNIVMGNIEVGSRKKILNKHQKALTNLVNAKSKHMRRLVIYKQKGGFIAALLPLVMGLLGPKLFGSS